MTNWIVLGDTGFLGSAFSRSLINNGKDFIGLNRQRVVTFKSGIEVRSPRKNPDLFSEISPYLSEDCIVINTIWGKNNREFRDSITQQENSEFEISFIDKLEASNVRYLSFGSIAEIDDIEISPSCGTEYARAKKMIAKRLLESNLDTFWIRVASSYGPNDGRDWLVPQLLENWRMKQEIHLQNPDQLVNLYHVDSLVAASLRVIRLRTQGAFNAVSIQWLKVRDVKKCFKNLTEPEYVRRISGPFSSTDPNGVLIKSPPISEYFAECQKIYKS
jgi:nucleoside-diphosphate-sugar epimerase